MTRPLSFFVVPAVTCFFLGLAALPSAKFNNLCNALRGPCPVARRAPSNSPLGPLSAWNHRCASLQRTILGIYDSVTCSQTGWNSDPHPAL